MRSIADQLFELAQKKASLFPSFQERVGPGLEKGNGVTNDYLKALNQAVADNFPTQVLIQERVAPGVKYTFDFYVPSEQTAVEIALSLRNIVTEFEKDIFKGILAKDSGKPMRKLVLIGKEGSVSRQNGTGPTAIKCWVLCNCGIEVEVRELI
jgi:hypothetical protein